MITRFLGTPRLVVRTSLAMFAVVTIVLTAILLLVGFLTNWFAFLRSPATGGPPAVEEKKDGPAQTGTRE